MKITRITVHAGRTFNHPYERYANYRFDLSLEADLNPDEEPGLQLVTLQRLAEGYADEHKAAILSECERLQSIERLQDQIKYLKAPIPEWSDETVDRRSEQLKEAMTQLAELKAQPPLCGVDIHRDQELHPGHPEHPDTTYETP